MKDALIFGASGGLGISIIEELQRRGMSYAGTYNNNNEVLLDSVPEAKENLLKVNLWNDISNENPLSKMDFRFAISTVGFTDVDACYYKPLLSFKTNTFATFNAAIFCAKKQIPFYFFSTNDVFCGKNSCITSPDPGISCTISLDDTMLPWTINQTPKPVGVYACHKRSAEKLLISLNLNSVEKASNFIVRGSLISFYKAGGKTFICAVLDSMKQGKTYYGMTDQVVNPLYTGTIAKELIDIGSKQKKIEGPFIHLATNNWMTRYDFIQYIADKVKKIDPSFISPKFKLVECTLEDLYNKKIMVDKRSQQAVLCPYPSNKYTLEGETDKALNYYFKTTV